MFSLGLSDQQQTDRVNGSLHLRLSALSLAEAFFIEVESRL